MNRWEQEFQHLTLEEQKKVLEAIRNTYEQAAIDCQNRIAQLNARTDMQNLQSIIYRRQYQEAILNQINETLADLNATNYETIHDYVEQCYVNGYIGAMYDLSQQGIPIITPIDQRDVFRATVTDSRLSEGLYSALGEDVNELKDAVRRELSRGIAQGSSWVDVARNLSTHMVNSPFRTAMNNSMRIARTEGHRVQMQGSMDALHVAKDKGADVLKQWDAALDANTRTSHQHVDGEIREVDEKFSNGLMFPSDPKGSAAEVINCRCALLHRARWGLDEDELETLKKRAEYFDLDKTDNFNDFKKKYLGITDEIVPDVPSVEIPEHIQKEFDAFIKKWGDAKTEHSRTIGVDGKIYDASSKSKTHTKLDYAATIQGSSTIHNHPIASTFSPGDIDGTLLYGRLYEAVVDANNVYYLINENPTRTEKDGVNERWGFLREYRRAIEEFEDTSLQRRREFIDSTSDLPIEERRSLVREYDDNRLSTYDMMDIWLSENASRWGFIYFKKPR